MLRKIGFSLNVIFLIFIIVFSGCDKNEPPNQPPNEPEFESLAEEIDYLANQYVEVGLMIGVINKQ